MLYRFQERARYTQHGKPLPQSGSGSFPSFYREALQHTPRWTPYVAPLMERCYHQRNGGTGKLQKTNATETLWREEWPNSWRITYNRPCVSYREPYPLPLSSVMVSCEKVSCYDTRYADQNQPMCICHSQPPFLFPARRKPTMTPTVRNSASL